MSKRIGLFGGSFDPIHLGHINLAVEMKEKHHLHEIWFIPAICSPHKMDNLPISFNIRKKMIELAIRDLPGFYVNDVELSLPTPSYTVDTLLKLREDHPSDQFFVILGEDAALRFHEWKLPNKIIEIATLLVGSRFLSPPPKIGAIPSEVRMALEAGWTKIRIIEISSQELRARLGSLFCGHLLPQFVWQYIQENKLYKCLV